MKKLDLFIQKHNETENSRSSFSNLIKKIRLENDLSIFIEDALFRRNSAISVLVTIERIVLSALFI